MLSGLFERGEVAAAALQELDVASSCADAGQQLHQVACDDLNIVDGRGAPTSDLVFNGTPLFAKRIERDLAIVFIRDFKEHDLLPQLEHSPPRLESRERQLPERDRLDGHPAACVAFRDHVHAPSTSRKRLALSRKTSVAASLTL